LRTSPQESEEWDVLAQILTTNETYFFREESQIQSCFREAVPALRDAVKGRRRLCLWSAGCATGEEAYTLAILALETGLNEGVELRILGTDVSDRCIQHAKKGWYAEHAFRRTPPDLRKKYFLEGPEGFCVSDEIRSMVHFSKANLLDQSPSKALAQQDVVFCRNVLIYMSPSARPRIVEALHHRMNPGGILCLGHAESLLNLSTAFDLLHLSTDLVYKKPEDYVFDGRSL
jgi:chemotaxis protein methyltransferase CheR